VVGVAVQLSPVGTVRIKSEHVARVLDVGALESGDPYMVMERLEGNDLAALLRSRGRFSLDTVVDYILRALDAIAEAHSLGIVHRDLKSANLFLAPGGAPSSSRFSTSVFRKRFQRRAPLGPV
jgi:serine/threonine-protein kinase